MTAGPHRDLSIRPQHAAASGTSGVAIRYPISVLSPAGRSPPASFATMMPTWTSSRISRTPTAASIGTFIRWFRAVISSAYPASARPATMIVVGTTLFTHAMLLPFVVTVGKAGSARAGVDHRPDLSLGRLQAEERDRPSQARLLPRGEVGVRGKLRDQVELAVGAGLANLGSKLGQLRRARQADREKAVPAQRPPHRPPVRPLAGYPHRGPGPLHRDRLELPGPISGQGVEAPVEQPSTLARVGHLPERL